MAQIAWDDQSSTAPQIVWDGQAPGMPSSPPTFSQRMLAGPVSAIGQGAGDAVYGIGQAVPRAMSEITSLGGNFPNPVSKLYDQSAHTVDQAETARDTAYNSARTATGQTGFDYGRLAGNVISPANAIGAGVAGVLPKVTGLAKPLMGAAIGAMYGSGQPVPNADQGYAEQAEKNALTGGMFGAAAPVVGGSIGKILAPKVGANQQALMDEGIRLTPGQIAGGNAKSLEDKLTSVPIVGGMIKNAQAQSMQDLNTAQANRALNPIGESLPAGMNGREAVAHVKATLGNAYDDLLPKLVGQNDPEFKQGIQNIRDLAAAPGALPAQQKATLNGVIDREIVARMSPNGSISGQSLKDINTALNLKINNYKGAQDPYDKDVLGGLKEIQSQVRQMTTRTNPTYAPQLSAIDTGYANYARLRQAAASLGANEGTFTPAQLSNAIKNADKSVGHGDYATGRAYGQDLSDAAKTVLPQKYPDSGTAGRDALLAAPGYLGAAYFHPLMAAGAAIGTGAAAGLYTKPGQAMAQMLMAQRPEAMQAAGNAIGKFSDPQALARLLYAP